MGYNQQQEIIKPKKMMDSEPSTPAASETMAQNDSQWGQFAGKSSEKGLSSNSRRISKRYTNDAENVTFSSNDEPQFFDESTEVSTYSLII